MALHLFPPIRPPTALDGPIIQLSNGHERHDEQFSGEMTAVACCSGIVLEPERNDVGINDYGVHLLRRITARGAQR